MKWKLRTQFLLVMGGLLLVCLLVYLLLAISVFKSDKTELVFEINKGQVLNIAHELEAELSTAADKLKMFAYLTELKQRQLEENLLSDASDLVFIALFQSAEQPALSQVQNSLFLEAYGLPKETFFSQLITDKKIPFEKILQQEEIIWNATQPSAPPLIGIGKVVVLEDEQGRFLDRRIVVGFVKLDRILKSSSLNKLSEIALSNSDGESLLNGGDSGSDFGGSAGHTNSLSQHPLFKQTASNRNKVTVSVLDGVLAASAKAYHDQIYIFSETKLSVAFQVVANLMRKTFLFASIIITLAMLISVLMSRRLTQNISLLTERMEDVSSGDLTSPILIKASDETGVLAKTFNQMIKDLKTSRDDLETLNRDLDQKVKDRTKQLEAQGLKIQEIQEALLRTTRLASIGEVAGRAAHEVLNPLTNMLSRIQRMEKQSAASLSENISILNDIQKAWDKDYHQGGAELLLKSLLQKSTVDQEKTLLEEDLGNMGEIFNQLQSFSSSIGSDLELLHSEGLRISRIVNNMRKLNRQASDLKACSMHQIISDSCFLLNDQFERAAIKVETRLEAKADLCSVDRDEVIQVFTNLMRNSLHSMSTPTTSASERKLTIGSRVEGDLLVIDVIDNGEGISDEVQQHLFDARFTTKGPDDGTGLGLSISRRFVRNFGGDLLFIESIPHTRTVFRIQIPLLSSQGVAA